VTPDEIAAQPSADDPGRPEALGALLEGARWFGGKGRGGVVESVRDVATLGPSDDGYCIVHLVEVAYPDGSHETYQVPLAYYEKPEARLDHAFVGWWETPNGWRHAYDAVHDPEAMAAWLHAFTVEDAVEGVEFHRLEGHDLDESARAGLLGAEQSNSSVAFGDDSLLKIFRKVHTGANPDITVHEVLTRAGSDHVAALYGWVETEPAPGEVMHLAMLQQFLRTATDGWELALASVRNLFMEGDLHADEAGGDFAAEAARLGTALREVHETLAETFPRGQGSDPQDALSSRVAAMHERLLEAVDAVPELEQYADLIGGVFNAAAEVTGQPMQQIHGDLHLGQTLRTVKGWKIVDFEGEPAKALSERVLPDSPWRDVAGMLRSFDYAPHAVARALPDPDPAMAEQRAYRAEEWSARNRAAFLEAYAGRVLTHDEGALLAAYLADKAVYECMYEIRNRPTWLEIPLEAIRRMAS
jgi:maltokinase